MSPLRLLPCVLQCVLHCLANASYNPHGNILNVRCVFTTSEEVSHTQGKPATVTYGLKLPAPIVMT